MTKVSQEFLNPKFLKYFIGVADTGSILSASNDLNVSQPSITRAVQIIEKSLKKKLFNRTKKGVKLTSEGEIFYLNAKSILAFNEKVIQNIQSMEINEEISQDEQITIGIPNTLTYTHKERILWLIKKNNQNKRIKLIENESYEIVNLIKENKIDFGISCINFLSNSISKVNLYSDPFCVAFYKGHKFQGFKEIDVEEVRAEDNYIFRNTCEFFYYSYLKEHEKFPSYNQIKKIIAKRKLENKDRDIIFTDSDTTAASCIKSGLGVAIIPESVAIDHKLLFKRIAKPSLNRNIYFIQNNENTSMINTTNEALKNALWL